MLKNCLPSLNPLSAGTNNLPIFPLQLFWFVLLFAFGSALALAKTAHLGGQIRHSEIRTAFSSGSPNSEKENNETGQPNGSTEKNTGKENND